ARYRPLAPQACPEAAIDQAAALLASAERPLIMVGGGVNTERATALVAELAEATGIPVATLQYDPDAYPSSYPGALGMLGRNGWTSANRAAPQADVVVAVGAHLDVYSTAFKYGVI